MSEQLIVLLEKTISLRRAALRQTLSRHGLHLGQPEMLIFVRSHPGCSQREMAEVAGVTPASIAASFKRMENAGLICRRSDTADLRCNRVFITQRGEAALDECLADMEALNSGMVQGLEEDEIESLCRCIQKINLCLKCKGE